MQKVGSKIKEKSKMDNKLTRIKKLSTKVALFERTGERGQRPALP